MHRTGQGAWIFSTPAKARDNGRHTNRKTRRRLNSLARHLVSAACHGVLSRRRFTGDGRRSRRRKGASPETGKRCSSILPGLLPPVPRVPDYFLCVRGVSLAPLKRGGSTPSLLICHPPRRVLNSARFCELCALAIGMSPVPRASEFRSILRAVRPIFFCPAGRENFAGRCPRDFVGVRYRGRSGRRLRRGIRRFRRAG